MTSWQLIPRCVTSWRPEFLKRVDKSPDKTGTIQQLCSLIALERPIATVRHFSTVSSRKTVRVSDLRNGRFLFHSKDNR